ncbi:hypothetical protein C4X49_10605 [Acinetobacter baumannii]|nr:hypothetical protein C4X49_10605 [Acinetobacter baumannii]
MCLKFEWIGENSAFECLCNKADSNCTNLLLYFIKSLKKTPNAIYLSYDHLYSVSYVSLLILHNYSLSLMTNLTL